MSEGAIRIICAAYQSGLINFSAYCQICRTYRQKAARPARRGRECSGKRSGRECFGERGRKEPGAE
ncbi:MAG TPA: hypothetical protein IAB28_10970 [Candidatus Copromonas faecavium]|uniref:Uncharacterized protein n=1 Tax=Candidatus Copromonas faecavium (nom. illeg.) TaxID=2840740 RepID=A0A9D1D621_9FIRM|nr:hypothetical protein [Candidatus Copromonas faecavium]